MLYERLRTTRGEAIERETFKQRDVFHMVNGPEQEARDELFLSQLGKELKGPFPSRWTCPEVQPWLYGYDVYNEAEEALKKEPFTSESPPAWFTYGAILLSLQQIVKSWF
ncbi:hypothetical protein QQZ08_007411 [Neonectria magnoliae]|uniref:Uncharacterized protein n=1 Tax=Neonectria magnoliae TaxID=2732573 RepID=A0ABR1HYB6_9HYPO